MRKLIPFFLIAMFVSLPALAKGGKGGGGKSSDAGPKKVSIQVRETAVKSAPNYLSGSVGTLKYGAQVDVVEEQDNWYKISSPAGWIPANAARKGKVDMNAEQKFSGTGVKHDEAALAGKGFNPQVEAQYKKDNANLAAAYVQVDKVEAIDVPDATVKQFIVSGKLKQ